MSEQSIWLGYFPNGAHECVWTSKAIVEEPIIAPSLGHLAIEAGAIATNAWMLFIFNRTQGPMSMSFSGGVGLGVMETEKAVLM